MVDSAGEQTALKALHLLKEQKKKDPTVPTPPEMFVIGTSTAGHTDLRTLLNDKASSFATHVDVSR